jgi:hypothetical protein
MVRSRAQGEVPPTGRSTTVADVLRSVRLTGTVFFDVIASSPWVLEAPSSAELAPLGMPGARHLIEYHVVTNGACWADTVNGDMEPIRLNRDSLIIFPRGDALVHRGRRTECCPGSLIIRRRGRIPGVRGRASC